MVKLKLELAIVVEVLMAIVTNIIMLLGKDTKVNIRSIKLVIITLQS